MTTRIPTYITRDESAGVWLLEVQCPHCGDRHQHGGGPLGLEQPDLGLRLSHCLPRDLRGEYDLIAGDIDMERPEPLTRKERSRLSP
jgi:hypothetical protein